MWARYSSAQFDQGAGRHACTNPYNAEVDESIIKEALKNGKTIISHKDFLDLIGPSFAGVEDPEDMNAILARTHLIVLTDAAVYWRLARADKGDVDFITWPANEPRDLLAEDQKVIFQEYKRNPDGHCLPPRFHEDAIWSQELIGKLLRGEDIPRTITVRQQSLFGAEASTTYHPPSLLPSTEMKAKVEQEKSAQFFKALKRLPRTFIDWSSPSPVKRPRPSCTGPPNPSFLGMEDDESFPNIGVGDDLAAALGEAMDNMQTDNA